MPIPTYDALLLPVLRQTAGQTWTMRALVARIADEMALTPDEREEPLPSGTASVIASRVGWAKTYLKQAGLVEQPKRATLKITDRGRELLATDPGRLDVRDLQRYPEFRAFLTRTRQGTTTSVVLSEAAQTLAPAQPTANQTDTPEEQIASAAEALDEALKDALLARILEATPNFFERLIIDLLLAMGYGGSRADAGEQLGRTGDGGVDGVIREDQLGLDRVYLQAKRYQPGNTVGSEAVQAFLGALVGRGSHKGVLITTSTFSKAATQVAGQSGQLRLVLIDGAELTRLMVRFGVGVRTARTIEIKRIDPEYFQEIEPE